MRATRGSEDQQVSRQACGKEVTGRQIIDKHRHIQVRRDLEMPGNPRHNYEGIAAMQLNPRHETEVQPGLVKTGLVGKPGNR